MKLILKYIQAISSYTIYLFANVKLILLALTSIIFHDLLKKKEAFDIQIPYAKYIILLIGVIGLANLKLRNFSVFSFCSLFYCFWWAYITFKLGAPSNYMNLHAVSLIIESCAMLYLAYRIREDKGLSGLP